MKFLLLALLCLVSAYQHQNLAIIAKFTMYDVNKKPENGYFTGTMKYFYNETVSYRRLDFDFSDNSKLTEEYVYANYPVKNNQNNYINVKLSSCDNNCVYKGMTVSKASETYLESEYLGEDLVIGRTDMYIQSVDYDEQKKNIKGFKTKDNYFYLSDVSIYKDNDAFDQMNSIIPFNVSIFHGQGSNECLKISCNAMLDLLFVYDISGSMSSQSSSKTPKVSRLQKAVDFALELSKKFGINENGTRVGIVTFTRYASLYYPKGSSAATNSDAGDSKYLTYLKYLSNHPLSSNETEFVTYLKAMKASGNTCITCGYHAGIEIMHQVAEYERLHEQERYKRVGRVIIMLSDGAPTDALYDRTFRTSLEEATVKGWNRGTTTSTSNTHTVISDLAKNMNKTTTWGTSATVISISAYAAASSSNQKYLKACTQRGAIANPNFQVFYSPDELTDAVLQDIYDNLVVDICKEYGDEDKCSTTNAPCCGERNYCPTCDNFDEKLFEDPNSCFVPQGSCSHSSESIVPFCTFQLNEVNVYNKSNTGKECSTKYCDVYDDSSISVSSDSSINTVFRPIPSDFIEHPENYQQKEHTVPCTPCSFGKPNTPEYKEVDSYFFCERVKNNFIEGCHSGLVCSNITEEPKYKCSPFVNECEENVRGSYCYSARCNVDGLNSEGYPKGHCEYIMRSCLFPPELNDQACYTAYCEDAYGGCIYLINSGSLNSCGECKSELSCNPALPVIASSIAAGVVAAIVIAAVVAVVIASIASKKVYDLISTSNETKMDTAQENSLYESKHTGGDNPIFQ